VNASCRVERGEGRSRNRVYEQGAEESDAGGARESADSKKRRADGGRGRARPRAKTKRDERRGTCPVLSLSLRALGLNKAACDLSCEAASISSRPFDFFRKILEIVGMMTSECLSEPLRPTIIISLLVLCFASAALALDPSDRHQYITLLPRCHPTSSH
jgi:hypothetical protein